MLRARFAPIESVPGKAVKGIVAAGLGPLGAGAGDRWVNGPGETVEGEAKARTKARRGASRGRRG